MAEKEGGPEEAVVRARMFCLAVSTLPAGKGEEQHITQQRELKLERGEEKEFCPHRREDTKNGQEPLQEAGTTHFSWVPNHSRFIRTGEKDTDNTQEKDCSRIFGGKVNTVTFGSSGGERKENGKSKVKKKTWWSKGDD